jgi:hypothetical protein
VVPPNPNALARGTNQVKKTRYAAFQVARKRGKRSATRYATGGPVRFRSRLLCCWLASWLLGVVAGQPAGRTLVGSWLTQHARWQAIENKEDAGPHTQLAQEAVRTPVRRPTTPSQTRRAVQHRRSKKLGTWTSLDTNTLYAVRDRQRCRNVP